MQQYPYLHHTAIPIPDTLDEKGVLSAIASRLGRGRAVVWEHDGDQALVHLDSVAVKLADRLFIVGIDLETRETQRKTIAVPFAFGPGKSANMVAAVPARPNGDPLLVSRWGSVVVDAIWAAFLALVQDHAAQNDIVPIGVVVTASQLRLLTALPKQ